MAGEYDNIMIQAFPTNADAFGLPPEPDQCFDLTELPDPPDDWVWLDRRYDRSYDERMLRATTARVLARLHFWGVYYDDKPAPRKPDILRALWKFYYYCPEHNRPRTFKDFFDLERDHGPRLLGWEHYDHEVGPVSRFHPRRPDPFEPASFGFQRPPGIPEYIPDCEVERYLVPVIRQLHQNDRPQSLVFPTRSEYLGPDADPTRVRQVGKIQHTNEAAHYDERHQPKGVPGYVPKVQRSGRPIAKVAKGVPIAKMDPTQPIDLTEPIDLTQPMDPTQPMYPNQPAYPPEPTVPIEDRAYTPRGISPAIPYENLHGDFQECIESLEKTILKFTYNHLERSPYAPSKKPQAKKTAKSTLDLDTVQISTHSAHSHLKLNPLTLELDPDSTVLYPYRGRGPIWSGASCSVDCVIVVGMLLEIGCTNIDRHSWRYNEITELEKAYIEITNVNWEALSYEQNCAMRDLFRQKLCATVPSIKMGMPAPTWAIWSECTRNFAQFYFKYSTHLHTCGCSNQTFVETDKYANCVSPAIYDADANGVTLAELIERVVYEKIVTKCIHCGVDNGDILETRLDELPPRLVVSNYMGYEVRVHNHTDDVQFRYIDSQGREKIATYRWLGGIYHKTGHVRVYWTDQERGDTSGRSEIQMYDDEMNAGVIAGGISPAHATERVPYDWTGTNCFMFGVYERVINPHPDMLLKASDAITKMAFAVDRGNTVLKNHSHWENSRDPNPNDPIMALLGDTDENRVIPVAAEHIREVNLSQLPPSIGDSEVPDAFGMTNLQELLQSWPPLDDEDMTVDLPPEYENLFDSMLNSPAKLSGFPELWPNGVPGDNGTLNFPSLPRSDSAKPNKPPPRSPTPMMDYVHWPSDSPDISYRSLWGKPMQGGLRQVLGRRSREDRLLNALQSPTRTAIQKVTSARAKVRKIEPPSKKRPLEKQDKPSSSKEPPKTKEATRAKEPLRKKIKTEKGSEEAPARKEVKKEKASKKLRDIPSKKSIKGKEPMKNSTPSQDKKNGETSSSNPSKGKAKSNLSSKGSKGRDG